MKTLCNTLVFACLAILFSCDHEIVHPENTTTTKSPLAPNDRSRPNARKVSHTSPFSQCNDEPMGGGSGYSRKVTRTPGSQIIISSFTTAANFKSIIESATNATIYIDSIEIDLTGLGEDSIKVNAGVTIASGRGGLGAATILTHSLNGHSLFTCVGNNVRFTGLIFMGPSTFHWSAGMIKSVINSSSSSSLEVDNCEIRGWPHAGVILGGWSSTFSNNNKIHHNDIHSNKRYLEGLGYGVMAANGFGKIYGNVFENNWHDIAGDGTSGSGYEAYCNIIVGGNSAHNFDMHRANNNTASYGGKYIHIHHNDFRDYSTANIQIRGRQEFLTLIENNLFVNTVPHNAIQIESWNSITAKFDRGNLVVCNNIFANSYQGWYIRNDWNTTSTSNMVIVPTHLNDFLKPDGPNDPYQFSYQFGDYNGDSLTDIFKLENGHLYYTSLHKTDSFPSTSYSWAEIMTTNYSMNKMKFGYFNNNNKTDVLYWENGTVNASRDFAESWYPLLSTQHNFDLLKAGRMNNGSTDDLFLADGDWYFSEGAANTWTYLWTDPTPASSLLLGQFGTGNFDVFRANGSTFTVWHNGSTSWSLLKNDTTPITDLIIGDLNGNNISDLIRISDNKILLGGTGNWLDINTTTIPRSSFTFGSLH